MSGFVGFTTNRETKLLNVDGDATPAELGARVLAYAREMVVPATRASVYRLRLVDPDEEVRPDMLDENGSLYRRFEPGTTWADLLPDTLAGMLALGIAGRADEYVDQSWGYLIDLDGNALEVYQRRLTKPSGYDGPVLLDGMYRVVDFYLTHLPEREEFLQAVREESS